MRFLVTGASGFVARVVTAAAREQAHQVATLSRSASAGDFVWSNDVSALAKTLREVQPQVIFHGAGSASVARSVSDPAWDRAASLGTCETLLKAVALAGIKPVLIFPSSAAVYGNPAILPVAEDAPKSPISPYGENKLAIEHLVQAFAEEHGVKVIAARLFSVVGPSQRRLLVYELFEQAFGLESTLSLGGTGLETRDYVGEKDMAHAIVRLSTVGDFAPGFSAFNVASGVETSVVEVAELVRSIVAPHKTVITRNQSRPGDPLRWVADTSALRHVWPEWKPASLADVLQQTLAEWTQGGHA